MATETIQTNPVITMASGQKYELQTDKEKYYSSGGWDKIHPDYWVVNGKYYDLTKFIDIHPGGYDNMLLGRGRDCTELFQSVHSLSKLDLKPILNKYEIPVPEGYILPKQEPLTWEKDGFYAETSRRVKSYFEKQQFPNAHKADGLYWGKIAVLFVLYAVFVVCALRFESVIFSILASMVMNMSGFCIMHDASHSGVSKKPWVNRLCQVVWCEWNFWPHFSWSRHHVYGHHSYTGIHEKDPDLINAANYIRKHPNQAYKPRFETQHIHAFFLLGLAPNQHLGQSITYLRCIFTQNHLLNIPVLNVPLHDFMWFVPLTVLSFYLQFIWPFRFVSFHWGFLMLLAYWTTLGMGYLVNVIPNHDTIDTHHSSMKAGEVRDWGAQQVCATGNHSTGQGLWDRFVSSAYGGMNYQIEHHLYPQVSHIHYPAISKIIQQSCKEFGLPYVTHSWAAALYRYGELLWILSFPEVKKQVAVVTDEHTKTE